MPTYQYACTNPEGRHEFEVVQSFTDPAVSTCPTCGASVRKVYGSVGVVFKGSGFYRTDSRSSGDKAGASSSSSKESSSDSSSSSKDASSSSAGKDSGSSAPAKKESGSSSPSPATKAAS